MLGTKDSSVMPNEPSQFSAGMSGGMSSSSELSSSSASSPGSSSSPTLKPLVCMPNIRFRFLFLFLALFQLLFFWAFLASVISGVSTGAVSAKASNSQACTEDRAKGRRMPCSEPIRLCNRCWLSRGKPLNPAVSVARIWSEYGPFVKSTLMASLMSNSSIDTWFKMFGTSQTLEIRSLSRSWGRKTLMLKVTTTKVCNTDLRLMNSRFDGPHDGLSYIAGRMLCT
mmetsp:Transcript_90248/g.258246  ORF Transcript_90248/g.258246 Transcript_90248/m.258246 type:complete len:226 (-) Transcript_90248:962-1639(-)